MLVSLMAMMADLLVTLKFRRNIVWLTGTLLLYCLIFPNPGAKAALRVVARDLAKCFNSSNRLQESNSDEWRMTLQGSREEG